MWPLNAQYGTSDVTGNGNDGIATGTQLAPGPFGNADGSFLFSGTTSSYMDIPNNGRLDVRYSYTILAHIYPTGQAGPIFDYIKNYNGWGMHLWQTGPQQLFMRTVRRDGNLSPHVLVNTLEQNAWNYVGGTYDSSTGMSSLWNNGQLVGQTQLTNVPSVASQWPIRVARRNGDSRIYSGRIACLQLYDYAMTQEQIIAAREKCVVDICAIDTVFLLDRSSSIPRTGFNLAKQYIWGFAKCFTDQEIGVGVIAYDCVPKTSIKLGIFTASNSADLRYAIGDVEFTGGITRTAAAIKYMTQTADFREDVPRVMIIITDGNDEGDLVAKVEDARDAGITVYVVANGFTALVNNAALEAIAGGPVNVFSATGDPCDLANHILELCG
ncbi:collagen alpha-5(VI) chain-like [Branchiostoma floridae x Branchiostoma japonicum]